MKGEVEASNDKTAAKLLKRKGYVIISIIPKQDFVFDVAKKFKDRVTTKDVVNFTRQLATMMNAGLPITESLLILRNQSSGKLQAILSEVLTDVEGGHALSSSLSKYPSVFSKTYVSLIKSGEVGGVLEQVLAKLSETLEKQQDFQGKVKSAMIYPSIIVIGMVGVASVMLVFVVPKLTSLYDQFDAELPAMTKFLIGISDIASNFWYLIIIGALFLFYIFKLYTKTKVGKKKFDEFKFKIPLVGDLQRQVILTELTRTMSLMVGSRVSILESLYITSEVVGNVVIS